MHKKIVLLAKSRKNGNYCVAGIDLEDNSWVRIISEDKRISHSMKSEDVRYENGKEAEILDIISIPCKEHSPSYFQPENVTYNNKERFKHLGRMKHDELKPYFDNSKFIFHNDDRRIHSDFVKGISEDNQHSLMFIKPRDTIFQVNTYDGRKKIKCSFLYGQVRYRGLSVTDHIVEQKFSKFSDGAYSFDIDFLFVISLGEMFDMDCCHYKLIASVITSN